MKVLKFEYLLSHIFQKKGLRLSSIIMGLVICLERVWRIVEF